MIKFIDKFLRKCLVNVPVGILIVVNVIFLLTHNDELSDMCTLISKSDDAINTMASIFTGIYFSLFLLMISLPTFSSINKLGKKNFVNLTKMLASGLAWSLGYSIFQIVHAFNKTPLVNNIDFIIMVGFILSVIQTGTYFSIILKMDIMASFNASDEISDDVKYIRAWIENEERVKDLKK